MFLENGRPIDIQGRLQKEILSYDFLDSIEVEYQRIDHEIANTMEACAEIDRVLCATICKNLFLCNRQKTSFYLLMIPGNKTFKTKDISAQLNSSRLSFSDAEDMQRLINISPGSVSFLGLLFDKEKKVQLVIDKDVMEGDYIGCHPCINTSSIRIKTKDFKEKILPALDHLPIYVTL